jgi:AcrR family transcriptional regulator
VKVRKRGQARRIKPTRRKPAAPLSRALQKEATRAAILQSALQIFSEHGFGGASTRDIAAHAGVHHALIKYYYSDKESLWRAAVSFLFERQARELTLDPPPGGLRSRAAKLAHARGVLRRYVYYCAHHPEHARLMVQESVRDSARLRWAADTFVTRTGAAAEMFVRMLQKDGLLPDVSPTALVYIIVGAAQQFYTLAPEVRRVWKIDPSDPVVIESHVEALLAVLIG